MLFDLIEHEGLVLGGSTAINIVGAMQLAKDLGPGKIVVTILADGGSALSVEAVQPGLPAREEPAAAPLDGMSRALMSRVVVCGSLNMDVVVESARRPAAGETLLGAKVSFLPGGKGLNQAVAAARLGMAAAMAARSATMPSATRCAASWPTTMSTAPACAPSRATRPAWR